MEHHADVDTAPRHAVQPATETQVGAFQAERVRHVLQQDDAGLLAARRGSARPWTAVRIDPAAAVNPTAPIGPFVRVMFTARCPHIDAYRPTRRAPGEQCRIVPDTPAVRVGTRR